MNERRVIRLNIAGFAGFSLVYLAVKLATVSAAHYDYAKEIYNAQALRWVYDAANPPLYTWLLHGFSQIAGPSVQTVLVLSHALIFAVLLTSFALGRRLLGSAAEGALAAWLLLTLHQVFRFQFARTHSLVMVLAVLLALLVFAAMLRERRPRDYLLLGLVLGAGLLSKYVFAGFIGALFLGALLTRQGRRALFTPRLALTIAGLLAVALPVALAGADQWAALAEIFKSTTAPTKPPGGLPARLAALLGLAGALLAFTTVPVLAMGGAVAAARLRRSTGGETPDADADENLLRLLIAVMLAGIAILAAGVLSGVVSRVSGRFLLAFMLPLPFVLALAARRLAPGAAGLWSGGLAIALALVVQAAIRIVDLTSYCSGECTDLAPYDRLAVRLKAEGFARGPVTTSDVNVAGNLVAALPGAAATVRGGRWIARPQRPSGARCLIIWRVWGRAQAAKPSLRPPTVLIEASGLGWAEALARTRLIVVPWRWASRDRLRPFAAGSRRSWSWGVILLRRGEGACR
jgi:hypothetical protein